jgi:ubiquinone/menaquinone biosynthesis C-methylase UbiE
MSVQAMSKEKHIQRIIKYHTREAEGEYYRNVGDDPVYDQITWSNIEPFLPKRGWILDAGGGAGIWSIRMAEQKKCFIVLLDITPELLKTAKRRIKGKMLTERIEVLDADIRAIPHPEKRFDFILCEADPICICGDPEKAVSELSRVLKPNGYLAAGVDSTLYRAFTAISKGKSLDYVLEFLQTGIARAVDEALFVSKSFTPMELITLLDKCGLKTVRIVGKPISFGPDIGDLFVSALPAKKRQRIFESPTKKEKLARILRRIYDEPYIAGIGSHLHIVAVKKTKSNRTIQLP